MSTHRGALILVTFGSLYVLSGWQPQIALGIAIVLGLSVIVKVGNLVALKQALGK